LKKKTTLSFFDTNLFIMFCVIYAVMMIVSIAIGILSAESFYLSARQLIDQAIFCAAPVVTLALFRKAPFLKYFNDDDCSPYISVPTHYLISSAILLLAAFILARFDPVPISEYFSAIITYTQGYVIVVVLAILMEIHKIANVNRNLRKIQESKKNKE